MGGRSPQSFWLTVDLQTREAADGDTALNRFQMTVISPQTTPHYFVEKCQIPVPQRSAWDHLPKKRGKRSHCFTRCRDLMSDGRTKGDFIISICETQKWQEDLTTSFKLPVVAGRMRETGVYVQMETRSDLSVSHKPQTEWQLYHCVCLFLHLCHCCLRTTYRCNYRYSWMVFILHSPKRSLW